MEDIFNDSDRKSLTERIADFAERRGITIPSLPYNGSSGWSGSDTSKERAYNADKSGRTAKVQKTALEMMQNAGDFGVTWFELAKVLQANNPTGSDHHGTASGTLSILHRDDRIARLAMRRGRCKVYVLKEYVAGRNTEPHGRKTRVCPNCSHEF